MTARSNFASLNVSLAILFVLWLGAPTQIAWAEDSVTKDFEGLAARAPTFATNDFLYNLSPFNSAFPRKSAAAENDAQFSLLTGRASEQELEALLKHPDPKVRTLALAALFQKEDPQVLPKIVALADDSVETFPQPGEPAQSGPIENLPTRKQTVGDVASAMIKFYMEPAGYYYGIKGVGEQPGFADYWQKRKDRKYCASWFAVKLLRAIRGSQPPSRDYLPDILRVRHGIDQLPPDDRAWTLLWLRGVYEQDSPDYPNLLVTQKELVKILQQLGPEKLHIALQGHFSTDDPDLKPSSGNKEYYRLSTLFLYKHASDLFK